MLDNVPSEGPDDNDWLIVPNWDKFQHYSDRNPPWIKLYTKLLSNPEYLGLSLVERGLLTTIWVAYASNSGQLRVKQLRNTVRARYGNLTLIALNRAGFLYWSASKPLAPPLAPKKEVEREKEKAFKKTPRELETALLEAAVNVAADWKGGDSLAFDEQLAELERRFKRHLTSSQRDQLWTEALRRDR